MAGETHKPRDPKPPVPSDRAWTRRDLLIRGAQTVAAAGVAAGAAWSLHDPQGDAGLQLRWEPPSAAAESPLTGKRVVFTGALLGSGLGFLWFNAHPAEVFMGDTGSLALGGAIGVSAIVVKKEFLLIIAGGIFVLEAISVILQILYFKSTRKRLFMLAPIHHHFEMKGMLETKVTIRFWIITVIFALISLASLKLQ